MISFKQFLLEKTDNGSTKPVFTPVQVEKAINTLNSTVKMLYGC